MLFVITHDYVYTGFQIKLRVYLYVFIYIYILYFTDFICLINE